MIILLFLKAKLSIFAWGLIFVDENYLNKNSSLKTEFSIENVVVVKKKIQTNIKKDDRYDS